MSIKNSIFLFILEDKDDMADFKSVHFVASQLMKNYRQICSQYVKDHLV
jgi:hypothetical protein